VGKEWQDKALEKLDEMGLIEDADGAKIIDLEKWKLAKAVVRKKGKHCGRVKIFS
jgi:arginyl-tRNA synthetase